MAAMVEGRRCGLRSFLLRAAAENHTIHKRREKRGPWSSLSRRVRLAPGLALRGFLATDAKEVADGERATLGARRGRGSRSMGAGRLLRGGATRRSAADLLCFLRRVWLA